MSGGGRGQWGGAEQEDWEAGTGNLAIDLKMGRVNELIRLYK